MKKWVFTGCMFVLSLYGYAQKEANNWFMGDGVGLTWNVTRSFSAKGLFGTTDETMEGLPVFVSGSKISTLEGCFSLSDSEGNLLFYSDGMTIWNKKHTQMANGSGMQGHNSSAQSGIILPYTGHPNQYIAISIGERDADNMAYSIIDMTRDGGLGEVVTKNVRFSGQAGRLGESVTSILHKNGTDYWIIAPGRGTPTYLNAWQITSDGIQNTLPITTSIGTTVQSSNTSGYIKFTPNGEHFVWGTWHSGQTFFGDFDNETGKFSNIKNLSHRGYGVEFSPSSKYLYISHDDGSKSGIYVYNFEELLASSNPANVTNKFYAFDKNVNPDRPNKALQLGSDGRIYIALSADNGGGDKSQNMAIIDNPEDYPDLKIYKLEGFVSPGYVWMGLPSFAANWFDISIGGEEETCMGTPQDYSVEITQSGGARLVDYILWDFGDGSLIEKDSNASSGTHTRSHIYTQTGIYTITVSSYQTGDVLIAEKKFQVKVRPCILPVNPNIHLFH